MSNRFDIEVTALDRFASIFARFNRTVDKTSRPLANVERRANAAFNAKPIKTFTTHLTRGAEAVERVATGIGGLSSTAQAMLGMGAAGGIIGIGAGVLAFTSRYADMGTQVLRTSQRLAIGADELQLWAAAAKAAGYDGDQVTGSMEKLGGTLQDARWGRNPKVIEALSALGLDFRVKNGIVDVTSTMKDLAKVLERVRDPYTRSTIADIFGLSPETMMFLSTGLGNITARIEDARRKGSAQSVEALQQAEAQKRAIGELGNAWDRLANKIGGALSPPVTRMLNAALDVGAGAPTASPGTKGEIPDEWWRGVAILDDAESWRTSGPAGRTTSLSRGQGGAPARGSWSSEMTRGPAIWADQDGGHSSSAARLAADLAEARQELARTRSPDARAAIQSEIDRMVRVEVSFANAPAGTTARATSGGAQVPVRISRAMPEGNVP